MKVSIKKIQHRNIFDYQASDRMVWVVSFEDKSELDRYPSKAKAMADIRKYNLEVVK